MNTFKEFITENQKPVNLTEALEESIRSFSANKAGGKLNPSISGAKDFFKHNPGLTISAAALALSAYSKHKSNQRNTIKLFAKDEYEKRMMTSVVDALTQSKKFKLHRMRSEHGGRSWELKRV